MVGRFAELGRYREVFTSKESLILFASASPAIAVFVLTNTINPTLYWQTLILKGILIASLAVMGLPIILSSIKGLIKLRVNVDELISLALVAATLHGDFFEAAMIAFIMRLGAIIEETVSQGAQREISALVDLTPQKAWVFDQNNQVVEVDAATVKPGADILIKPGNRVPVDGLIKSGESELDEASMTGESLAVAKKVGDQVLAGTVNGSGALTVTATRSGSDTRLGRIIKMVKQAENSKPQTARLVDRFAAWFTPVILTAAGLTFWLTGDLQRALTVLIVGCPCAFILISPLGSLVAAGRAAGSGVLLKNANALEKVAASRQIYFDKTGTITSGKPEIVAVFPVLADETELISRAAALEKMVSHPLGKAIVKYAEDKKIAIPPAKEVSVSVGSGVSGLVEGREIFVGRTTSHSDQEPAKAILERGSTLVVVKKQAQILGYLEIADTVRKESAAVVLWLKKNGFAVVGLLSGDNQKAVANIGATTALSPAIGGLLPHEKAVRLEEDKEKTVFIGDGINDAPALATAGVGVAVNSGENLEVAMQSSDIIFTGAYLWKLPFVVRLSRRVTRLMKVDLLLALCFNGITVYMGTQGMLSPIGGAIMHNASAVAIALSFSFITLGLKAQPINSKST